MLTKRQSRRLGELGIVIVGVFIALIAEQSFSSLKTKLQVSDAKAAMNEELGRNLAAYTDRYGQSACVSRRLDTVERWIEGHEAGNATVPERGFGRIAGFSIRNTVWEIVNSGGIAANIPLKQRLDYASLYHLLGRHHEIFLQEREAWLTLRSFERVKSVAPSDIPTLRRALATARYTDLIVRQNGPDWIFPVATRLGIKPIAHVPTGDESRRDLCQPLTLTSSA